MLKDLCEKNGIPLSENQLEKFDIYLQVLLKWNRVYNLTSIRKKEEIVIKHFFDSLTLVKLFEKVDIELENRELADFGSGAGFPGVPLKIYYQDKIELFLIEAVQKKCIFLEMLRKELKLDFQVFCSRAEKLGKKFDIVVSRATGETFEVLKTAKGLLKDGGYLIIMKAKKIEEELKPFTISLKFVGYGERKFIVLKKNTSI
ncbi:MAG: 16S rRNA (guanine(527)-N(7))-methyltransferase RsmG [Aquificae bacterium]|nr:16S rRNA (guanine(527)-N(7))-methyltransferase RsmG [Aquificota bacterium]